MRLFNSINFKLFQLDKLERIVRHLRWPWISGTLGLGKPRSLPSLLWPRSSDELPQNPPSWPGKESKKRYLHLPIYVPIYIYTYIYIYIYLYICIATYPYIYRSIDLYMFAPIHLCIHMYIYIYAYVSYLYLHQWLLKVLPTPPPPPPSLTSKRFSMQRIASGRHAAPLHFMQLACCYCWMDSPFLVA